MHRATVYHPIPYSVTLPIEVLGVEEAFPFLDLTLHDLGIDVASIKERVVWVDSRRTQVRTKTGKLKEKEILILHIRVSAVRPGDGHVQEVTYGSESHTDRQYFKTLVSVQPWVKEPSKDQSCNQKQQDEVEMVIAIDGESHPKWQKTEEKKEF
ncbi:uncharacterized protein si:ch211-196f5.2 [Polypterus senegalus]|uniref:uncharacterized protein si:ch211-196f5.2 n=1 Tax=Polypterus senegalus TaxID=55291 RepID=UPI0019665434|nr:uncharacterized protein si:ch211-196f5.2 [Polypterus senegalus]